MATDTAVEEPAITADAEVAPQKSGGMLKWIVVIAILMLVEAGVFFLMMGPSAPSEEDAEQQATEAIADGLSDVAAESDLIEVPLEPSFSVTNMSADIGTTVHASFDIVTAVSERNAESFRTAVEEKYKGRLREVINQVVRSASLEELQDPDLNQLKRRIREDLNKKLQHSFVVEVIIPKMQLHVQ